MQLLAPLALVALAGRQVSVPERDDARRLKQAAAFRTWDAWVHEGILP
jgi:hypothetical protein